MGIPRIYLLNVYNVPGTELYMNNSFNPPNSPMGKLLLFSSFLYKTEALRDEENYPRSHSWLVVTPGFEPIHVDLHHLNS